MSSSASLLSLHQLRPRHASSRHHSPLPHPLFYTVPGRPPHRIPLPPPALSRRLFLPSASFIWDAITGGTSALEASSAVRRGMLLFRQIFGREGFPCITWTGVSSSPFLPNCRSRRRVLWKLKRIEDVAFMLKPNAGSRKGPSSSGQMLLRIPMIPRSLYGAFYVKLNFTELKKPGEDSCRLVEIQGLLCVKPITCLRMVVTLKSLFLCFLMAKEMKSFMLHYMLDFIMNLSSGDYMASLARVHCLCRNWTPGK